MADEEPCGITFKFVCARTWLSLEPTETPGERYCDQCKKNVYHCTTEEQALAHAVRGECVALRLEGERELVGYVLFPEAEAKRMRENAKPLDPDDPLASEFQRRFQREPDN